VDVESSVRPMDATISLSSENDQWAALIIKRPGYWEDALATLAFEELILENIDSWYTFAHDVLKIKIDSGDIRLVTGRVMTNEWSTVTVEQRIRKGKVNFKVGDPTTSLAGGISTSVWGTWTSDTPVHLPVRFGPAPRSGAAMTPSPQPVRITSDEHTVGSDGPPPNQCIFLRSIRVVSRLAKDLPVKTKAAAEPEDEGRVFDEVDQGRNAIAVVEVANGNLNASEQDVYKAAQDFIFMNSDADVALLHDDDVFQFDSAMDVDDDGDGDTGTHLEETVRCSPATMLVNVKMFDGVKVGSLRFSTGQADGECGLGNTEVNVICEQF